MITLRFEVPTTRGLCEEMQYAMTCEGDDGWTPDVETTWLSATSFELRGTRDEMERVLLERWARRAIAEGLMPAIVV